MGRLYVILAFCIGMFGCMASKFDRVHQAPVASATNQVVDIDTSAPSQRYAAEASDSDGDALVLDRRDDGHFYADVEINGTPTEMLIDTGASGVALSADDAKKAGIATSIGMNDAVGEGAGGTVYGDFAKVDRIKLGKVEADDVPAVILEGGQMSLLGQSFLRQFDSVEIHGDRMVLR